MYIGIDGWAHYGELEKQWILDATGEYYDRVVNGEFDRESNRRMSRDYLAAIRGTNELEQVDETRLPWAS